MKQFRLILLLNVVFCLSSFAQDSTQERIDFANSFVESVQSKSQKQTWKHLNKAYRKEQKEFLQGNKQQLFDELFSGMDGDAFVVIPFASIIKIEIAEVIEEDNGNFTYIFRIRDGEHDILAPLYLIKQKKKWGFEGARG